MEVESRYRCSGCFGVVGSAGREDDVCLDCGTCYGNGVVGNVRVPDGVLWVVDL